MQKLKRFLRFLFSKQSLSESLSWGVDRNRGKMRPDHSVRKDCVDIDVCDGVRVQVYWKKVKLGKGPALSLFILDEEILRVDCVGEGAAHLHAAFFLPGRGENRYWIPEATILEQIDRAKFELHRNYKYYQDRVPNPKIRAIVIPSKGMKEASDQAFEIMNGFMNSKIELN